MKYLKFALLPIIFAFFITGYFFAGKVFAFGGGVYTNISGSGYVQCTDNCNALYKDSLAECTPDTGTCTGSDLNNEPNWWTYKFVCDGKHNECGGNGPAPINSSKVKGGAVTLNQGVSCGKTIQLDVFDKECDADPNNWSCGGDSLKGYMVWYSGDCTPPPVACDTSCADDPNICQQATGGCTYCNPGSQTCQTPPACGTGCDPTDPNNNICQQATGGCTYCNPGTSQCETPPVTETPTTTPPVSTPTVTPPTNACGVSCDGNPNICTQATDGCTRCDLTSKRCVPPSGTPTVTPPTTIPPTPTVTTSPPPDFDPGACKCDGMSVGPLIAGQNATFTANAKVEGTNVGKATVKSMTFYFGESAKGATNGTALGSSGPIPAQKTSSPNKDSYTASWTYKLPTTVTGKSYRAWATIQCDKNAQANAGNAKTAVLAAEDTNTEPSFFGKIVNFFKGIFGQNVEEDTAETIATTQDAQIEQINLGTVQPGNVTLKACSMLFFEFPEMK